MNQDNWIVYRPQFRLTEDHIKVLASALPELNFGSSSTFILNTYPFVSGLITTEGDRCKISVYTGIGNNMTSFYLVQKDFSSQETIRSRYITSLETSHKYYENISDHLSKMLEDLKSKT